MAQKRQTDFAGLKVNYHEHCTITRERTEEAYSGEDTSSTWTIEGVNLTEEYPDVTACFEVKSGDPVYLVYLVYSTGDSFSRNEDGSIKFIDLFKTHKKATACAKAIREHADKCKSFDSYEFRRLSSKEQKEKMRGFSSYQIPYKRENGEVAEEYASWNGYFERLSYIEVVQLVVDQGRRDRY